MMELIIFLLARIIHYSILLWIGMIITGTAIQINDPDYNSSYCQYWTGYGFRRALDVPKADLTNGCRMFVRFDSTVPGSLAERLR